MKAFSLRQKLTSLALVAGLFLCLCLPVAARDREEYFLAVYSSFDFPQGVWAPFQIDMFHQSTGWADFTTFLDRVKLAAGDRKVIIDLSVHGLFYLDVYKMNSKGKFVVDHATFGAVINAIEQRFDPNKVIITCESCFSGNVYAGTIRKNTVRIPDLWVEDHPAPVPFPIYGVGDKVMGISNIVFRQYFYHIGSYLIDLRDFETKSPRPRDLKGTSKEFKEVENLWQETNTLI